MIWIKTRHLSVISYSYYSQSITIQYEQILIYSFTTVLGPVSFYEWDKLAIQNEAMYNYQLWTI